MGEQRPHEHYESLLMKAVDGALTVEEEQVFKRHLDGCERCREELEDFTRIKETTDMMMQRILADAKIEPPREGKTTRLVLSVGFVLLFAGLAVMLGFGLYNVIRSDMPVWAKGGLGLALAGCLILFIHVAHIRFRAHKHDPYTEVDL